MVRLLVDRRDELGRARTDLISRIHHLLLELVPGGAKKFLTRGQASYLLRTAPAPDNIVAQTRHDLARELIEELATIDAKIRATWQHDLTWQSIRCKSRAGQRCISGTMRPRTGPW